jgi:hypothetical protein
MGARGTSTQQTGGGGAQLTVHIDALLTRKLVPRATARGKRQEEEVHR